MHKTNDADPGSSPTLGSLCLVPCKPHEYVDVAIADSRFVLEWLIQMHECPATTLRLPTNIEGLSRRALMLFSKAGE